MRRCEYTKNGLRCRNWATGNTHLCPSHRRGSGVELNPQQACAYLVAFFRVVVS